MSDPEEESGNISDHDIFHFELHNSEDSKEAEPKNPFSIITESINSLYRMAGITITALGFKDMDCDH
jgi:hypothetical protein